MILACRWPTAGRLPYFANLKVMRGVLGAVREKVECAGGVLGAYLFFDDEFRFLAGETLAPDERVPPACADSHADRRAQEEQERPGEELQVALQLGREQAAAEFLASDRKELWGTPKQQTLPDAACDGEVAQLLRAPMAAGLAPSPGDYPWCGGPWLMARL